MRYRYYITRPDRDAGRAGASCRIPAREIEDAVTRRLAEALDDPLNLAIELGASLDGCRLDQLTRAAQDLAGRVRGKDSATIERMVAAVRVLPEEIAIDLDAGELASDLGLGADPERSTVTLKCPVKLRRTGRAMRMVFDSGHAASPAAASTQLVKLILRARAWWGHIASGEHDRESLAREHSVVPSYVSRVLRLAFLSPLVVQRILSGDHPARLDGGMLLAPGLPASWSEQERVFLGA